MGHIKEILKMISRKVSDPTKEILARVRKSNMQRANFIARQQKIAAAKAVAKKVVTKPLSARAQRRHARRVEEALEM
jgi:hypothetical protein